MSFDQLNNIVLLEIFDQMSFDELVNVSDLGERYHEIVIQHYMIPKFKIHNNLVKISFERKYNETKIYNLSWGDQIDLRNIKIILKTLRNFGHLISKLEYDGLSANSSTKEMIGRYINEYCQSALIEINYQNFNDNEMDEWRKPFEIVETVAFDSGVLNKQLSSQLSRIFPKLRSLRLSGITVFEKTYIEQHFPFLESFYFFSTPHLLDINQFLTLNRQLKALHMAQEFESDFPQFLNETLPELEELSYSLSSTRQFKDNNVTYLSNVLKLCINALDSNEPQYFPFIFPSIEELTLFASNAEKWINVITQMKSMKKLVILIGRVNTQQWRTITRELTHLQEIKLEYDASRIDDIIGSIESHENLLKVTFRYLSEVDRQYISDTINSNWKLISDHSSGPHSHIHDTVFQQVIKSREVV